MKELLNRVWLAVRSDTLALFGLIVLFFMIILSLFAPLIAMYDPNKMNYRSEGSALWIEDGIIFLQASITEHTLRSVAADAEGFVAVGEMGTIATYKGTRQEGEWDIIDMGFEQTLRAVSADEKRALAVGNDGVVLYRDAQGTWHKENTPAKGTLFGAGLAGADMRIAVGENGKAIVYREGEWINIDTGVPRSLLSVSLADEDFGFVVGERGTIIRWDGTTLHIEESPTFRDLLSVAVRDRDYAIAVGERGTVLHWDGESWNEMQSALSRSLRSVSLATEDRALVVGNFGDMMVLEDGRWQRIDSGYDRHFRGSTVVGDAYVAVGTDPYINALSPPSREHLFGTTHNGRDIFSQVLYGGRTALMIGFLAALMVTVIGTNVGLISGYFGGRTDSVFMRIVDIMYALPLEPFAMILVLIGRPGVGVIILAVGLLTWRTTARLIRSQVLSIVKRPFVKAARMAGSGNIRTMYIHIAPNVLPLAFLQLAVAMAFAITAEATLSFLGLGPPRLYSWGTILHQARLSGAWRTAWWWTVPPGVLIMITVVSVFFISRALEIVANPRLRQQ